MDLQSFVLLSSHSHTKSFTCSTCIEQLAAALKRMPPWFTTCLQRCVSVMGKGEEQEVVA
eukprot:scaffold165895_cov43-Cyclotella_meneghiniana.AAC.1